ncbi:hypothetical protein RDABS01_040388 [Bienertia sinuspersici]
MLSRISSTHLRTSIFNQVCSSLSSSFRLKLHQYNISAFLSNSSPSSISSYTHLESPPITAPILQKLHLSTSFNLWNHQVNNFFTANSYLNQLLLDISYVSPETCRKYLRVSSWKPEYVLEILLGFQLSIGNSRIHVGTVKNLWEIFGICDRNVGFKHLPRSCEVMASMLVNVGMFREVETLLSTMETQGILLANDEIFSGLIEGYVNLGASERALLMYDTMRRLSLHPSLSCYCSLIDLLVKEGKANQAIRIYEDVIEVGFEFGDVDAKNLKSLIGFLCSDGKIREARKLLKNIVASGSKPSALILSEVAFAYCEKKDFEDLLSFYIEMKCAPDILVGNKIIYSLCSNFGVGRANSFMWKLEDLGFIPNEITFGIFICWSCLDGKIRDAFSYLSEILSRGMKPDRHSYNALISSLFKAGMHDHAREVLNEMIDDGIKPNLATYRVLLAGYSIGRQFNEVQVTMKEMVDHGFISLSPLENPISKAFAFLGLNPLKVKLKRDNDVKNFRTEYVDTLGNGLYLDTDIDEFERTVTGVLDESLIPDVNLLVMRQCGVRNLKEALSMVDEMLQWGQELSIPVFSTLVRLLCESSRHIKAIPALLDKLFWLIGKLDHEALNFVVEALGKKGFVDHCMLLLLVMHRRHLPISNSAYTKALVALCKLGRTNDILYCWSLAREDNWSPDWDNFVIILESLCHRRMLKAMLEVEECRQQLDVVGYNYRMHGHLVSNDIPKSTKLLNDLIINGVSPKSRNLRAVIGCLFRNGQVQSAVQLSNQIESRGWILFSTEHYVILEGLSSDGRIPTIEKGLTSKLNHCSNLIWNLCQYGKTETAVNLLDQILKKRCIPNASSYDCIVQSCCAYNILERAMDFFCEMLHRNLKPSTETWGIMIQKLCENGKTKEAESLLILMVEVGESPTKGMYSSVIDRYRLENNLSKASELLNRMQQQGYEPDFGTQWSLISSLSNSNDQKSNNGTEGFLSKLLVESGFPSESPKSKLK